MLPFHVSSFFGNDIRLTGVALPKQDGLHICIHEGEVPTDLFDAKTKSVVIHWDNIDTIDVKESVFGDSLTIAVRSTVKNLPGAKKNKSTLDLHKRDRDRYDEFRQEVAEYQAGKQDEDVDGMIDDIRDFLTDM
ncbi:MAG: hypothetical protein KDB27_01585 [Planctomycetales bacterium]|nr:hypothetical protein [Planctomycetales bacterium]